MAAPSKVVYDSTNLRRKVRLPEEAYRIARDFLEDVIDSSEFNSRMRDLGVDLTEAYDLYRTLRYEPWLIEFEIVEVRYWEGTRYYRYVASKDRMEWRAFEVRAAFALPAAWSDDRAKRWFEDNKLRLARLMEDWLNDALDDTIPEMISPITHRDLRAQLKRVVGVRERAGVLVIGETGWGELGVSWRTSTGGWEKGGTDTLPDRETIVEYIIIDKTGKYPDFPEETPYVGEDKWTVPEEE